MTDQFPMENTRESGWKIGSHVFNTSAGFWSKRHSGFHCIDEKTTGRDGTLTGDDGHYSAILGMARVRKSDQIRIDIGRITDVGTKAMRTVINVFKNNETTAFQDFDLPEPVPKVLYPSKRQKFQSIL